VNRPKTRPYCIEGNKGGLEPFCPSKIQRKIGREEKYENRRRRKDRKEKKGEAEMQARGTMYLTALKAG
jgi:hypothetical protein